MPYHITLQPKRLTVVIWGVASPLLYCGGQWLPPPPPPPPPFFAYIAVYQDSQPLGIYINDAQLQRMLLVNRHWRASPFPPSLPRVCALLYDAFPAYIKAGWSPAGLSLQSRLAKPGPASWLGSWCPTAGEFGYRDRGSWDTPALAPICCQSVNQ